MSLAKQNDEYLDDNYYSAEANRAYMSVSQYKDFIQCEAMAVAKLNGEWVEEPTDAMLVGSYVDAAMEGTLDQFKATHPELFTQKGELKAQYKQADVMVKTLQEDPFMMAMLDGVKQMVITAEFAGVMWKAKLDVYNPVDGRIVDLKTCKSLSDKHWNGERYVSFVEAYRYTTQLAVYAELERIWAERYARLEPLIVAVTKEDIPDKAVIGIDVFTQAEELDQVRRNIPRIQAIKNGLEKPTRCEKCKYCRATKKVTRITHFRELIV